MAASTNDQTVEALLQQGKWDEARKLIRRELTHQPDNHWLLTQLGVTYYEQRRYRQALKPLLSALAIVPDCPLTLWNLAGTYDALGKPEIAIALYTRLLKSKKSPADDPCWESEAWADNLKTDCVYRLGVSFQHLGRRQSAEHCYRQYVNLLLAGMSGSYPIEDAARHIRDLHGNGKPRRTKKVQEVIDATLEDVGIRSIPGGRRKLPKRLAELLAT
jgi:tetratricopeptide (TPR) repeat protein